MEFDEFHRRYLDRMNGQQREAVLAVEGPVLLLAVPGSGKTTVLVTRLGYMILCRDIPAERILTMTYTRAATLEMTQRYRAFFGEIGETPQFHTINSLSLQIIRYYAQCKGRPWSYRIPQNREDHTILRQLLLEIQGEYPTDSAVSEAFTAIAYIKNQMLSGEEIRQAKLNIPDIETVYSRYDKAMHDSGFMDFDDQMVFAHRILTKYPEVCRYFQEQYPYICVDESQDTSKIQHAIIRLLAEKSGNLFMVGDEDQSIYGFRAAYPQALLDFESDYPNARVLLMETNYRSTEEIVAAANGFISRNQLRHPKQSRATQGSGCAIRLFRCQDRNTQYQFLLREAESGAADTAVLFRNSESALPLIDLLERRGLDYQYFGSDDTYFSNKVVLDIVDILRFALDPRDGERFLRIYYKLGGGISREIAGQVREQCQRTGKAIPDILASTKSLKGRGLESARDLQLFLPEIVNAPPQQSVAYVLDCLKYADYLKERGLDRGKADILKILARQEPTVTAFLQRLEALQALIRSHENRPEVPLILSTIHSSKGLEYTRVILLDLFDGILPAQVRSEAEEADALPAYEEDRRLCYVAMTRAKRELVLFSASRHPSEFVSEIRSRLPKLAAAEDDLFAPLNGDLLGKQYADVRRGTGTVIAQWEDHFLVNFPEGDPVRMTLAEMAANREKTRTTPEEAPATLSADKLRPGCRVNHRAFGSGTVIALEGDSLSIRFDADSTARTLLLSFILKNGLLHEG